MFFSILLAMGLSETASAQSAKRHQISLGTYLYLTQSYRDYLLIKNEVGSYENALGPNPVFSVDYRYNIDDRIQLQAAVLGMRYSPSVKNTFRDDDGSLYPSYTLSTGRTTWFLGFEAGLGYRLLEGKKVRLNSALHAVLLGSGPQQASIGGNENRDINRNIVQAYAHNITNNPDNQLFVGARPQIELERRFGNHFFMAFRASYLWVPQEAARGTFSFTDVEKNISYSGPLRGSLSGFMLGVHFGTRF